VKWITWNNHEATKKKRQDAERKIFDHNFIRAAALKHTCVADVGRKTAKIDPQRETSGRVLTAEPF
jgi:hypothetical protein